LGPSGRFVIVGVLSIGIGFGSKPCVKEPYFANAYGDVRQHLGWICRHTGVCPKAIRIKSTGKRQLRQITYGK
ncbi:hypothetical protein GCK32_019479, partial [Trichostrongylus colubriformis]